MVLFKIQSGGDKPKLFLMYERVAEIFSEFLDKNGVSYSAYRVSSHYDPVHCLHFILDPDNLKALFYDDFELRFKGYTEIKEGELVEANQ